MNIERHKLRDMHDELSRRDLLRLAGVGLSGLGLAAIVGCGADDDPDSATATPGIVVDPPPETTTIRLASENDLRVAPIYLAEQFLLEEGFTGVEYVPCVCDQTELFAAGDTDMGLPLASSATAAVDRGAPLVALAGVHITSIQIFGNDRVQSLRDLRGKRVHVFSRDAAANGFYAIIATLLAYVGIDLEDDVELVEVADNAEVAAQISAGTIDAFLAIRPISTALRNANIGHVILDGAVDPPWSQYFGGLAAVHKDFAEMYPAATKRALRAILKATDVCATEPERAARYVVDKGFTPYTYDEALDTIIHMRYAAWREFNPEDTMRFYALRLKDAGLIKSTPDEIIRRGTDWRYLDEIKRELAV